MVQSLESYCDANPCLGGKHVFRHGCGHDICSLCAVVVGTLDDDNAVVEELQVCPICFAKASTRDE